MQENLYTPLCIRTTSGKYINVVRIKPVDVEIEDIAIGLARECRFGNYTHNFYSVAEHSIWCMNKGMELYPEDRALHLRLLMHDAHEAYIGDFCTPMVDAIDALYGGFKNAVDVTKKLIQSAINERFGMSCPLADAQVKQIDRMALEYEWTDKVLNSRGFKLNEAAVVEVFLDYFKKLVQSPVVVKGKAA
jgi:hypothetical protein